jgi:hypothetical protein
MEMEAKILQELQLSEIINIIITIIVIIIVIVLREFMSCSTLLLFTAVAKPMVSSFPFYIYIL